MNIAEFKQRISDFAGDELLRKSALRIRDGAGVIEKVLGCGEFKSVLEIGTYRGVTAAYMAGFVDQVNTIDLKRGKMQWDGQEFDRVRLWEALGIGNVSLHLVSDNNEKANLVSKLDFDFAFVDGDHTYQGVASDFELVKRCGAVLFHDYDQGTEVATFVDSLPKSQVQIMDIFALWRA